MQQLCLKFILFLLLPLSGVIVVIPTNPAWACSTTTVPPALNPTPVPTPTPSIIDKVQKADTILEGTVKAFADGQGSTITVEAHRYFKGNGLKIVTIYTGLSGCANPTNIDDRRIFFVNRVSSNDSFKIAYYGSEQMIWPVDVRSITEVLGSTGQTATIPDQLAETNQNWPLIIFLIVVTTVIIGLVVLNKIVAD